MRQDGQKEYEPTSIRSVVESLRKYLKEHNYGDTTLMLEFSQLKDVVAMVCKSLKGKVDFLTRVSQSLTVSAPKT